MKLPDELNFLQVGRMPQKVSTTQMDGKTVVITGATSGIGKETALRLAKAGAHVVMMVRNREKAEELAAHIKTMTNLESDIVLADFSDLRQVRAACEEILQRFPKIDVLINNAGVHMTTRQLSKDGFEVTFAVNHLASFLITSLLLNRLIESAPARILQVNSEGHRFNGFRLDDIHWDKRRYNGYLGYGASKTAQLFTVWELADLLKDKGVTINAMHPGAVRSNIGTNNGRFYNWFSRYLIQPLLKSPVLSGEALYYLASSPDMEGVSGRFFNLTNEEIPAPHARNRGLSSIVFEKSIEWTNLDKHLFYEI